MRLILQMSAAPNGRTSTVHVSIFDADVRSPVPPVWHIEYTTSIDPNRSAGRELEWLAVLLHQAWLRIQDELVTSTRAQYGAAARAQRESLYCTGGVGLDDADHHA